MIYFDAAINGSSAVIVRRSSVVMGTGWNMDDADEFEVGRKNNGAAAEHLFVVLFDY